MPVRARYAIIACSVLGITMAIYQLAKPKQPVDESMLMPEIRTETLKPGTLIHEIKNPGTVTYLDKASVASRVLGRVQQIFVEQGSRVKKGEKLAQMETFEIILKQRQAQGSAAQARAQMLLAQARYSAARREVEKQLTGIERTQSNIVESRAQLLTARQNLENKKELYDLGGVSGSELKQTYVTYLGAVSRLFQTRKEFQTQMIGFRDADLLGANISVPEAPAEKKRTFIDFNTQVDLQSFRASEAAYQSAQIELENTNLLLRVATIVSPLDGVVAARSIEIGEEAKQNEPLFTVVRMDKLVVETQLPEEEIKSIAPGSKTAFTADARAGKVFEGELYIISPVIDPKTRSIPVRIRFDNNENLLAPGMFVRTRIRTREKKDALSIPETAVTNLRDQNSTRRGNVFVVKDGLTMKREIVLGDRFGERYEVTAGLSAGEVLAIDGIDVLRDGARVKVKPELKAKVQEK
ncbi:MAG TPA: efflux RND transporter periplasmic adaptor subunit [Leptospiraceae bacterium]|nr:efflux RND transporter periplasmic adaptor subunit [Leptospiraceae bacterium]